MKITKILVASLLMLAVDYQIYAMDEERFALFQDEEDQADEKGTFDLLEDELELAHADIANAVHGAGRWLTNKTYETLYGPDQGLFDAVEDNRIADVQAILARGVNPNIQNPHRRIWVGETPLMSAALHGRQAIAEALLAAGANPNIQDQDGDTALMNALIEPSPLIMKLLVEDYQADLNLRNNSRQTALLFAIQTKKIAAAIYLIEHGAEYTQEDQDKVATDEIFRRLPDRFSRIPQEDKDQVFDAWQASQTSEYVLK